MLLLIRSRLVLLVLCGLGFLAPGCSLPPPEPGGGPPPPGFSLRDVAGVEHHPFTDSAVKAVALVFVLPDCPIANGYAANMATPVRWCWMEDASWCGERAPAWCQRRRCSGPTAGGSTLGAST